LEQDHFGNWIINREYNAPMLAQAVCKIEGFTYAPGEQVYWQQGRSSESDYIYVTTQTLTRQQIEALAEDVGPNRSLVVYCHAFRIKNTDEFPNLTLKKIPKAVLAKCEWGKDDYSLEIKNLPAADPSPPDDPAPPPRRRRRHEEGQPTLFAMQGGEQ
jgi:adenine-specific DNA-methyltransferase